MYQIDLKNPCHVYFIGIGGVSMSGLAMLLSDRGFVVSGSDRAKSDICSHMEELGIRIFYGQRSANITKDIDVLIYTSAIKEDNPERVAASELGIPMLTRGELMGQVMQNYGYSIGISGTHGKTTTTSMLSEILLGADTDPTLFVGGMLKSIDGNLRIGKSDYFVTEACEYTNSFLSFFPKAAAILNIEEDHLDFFKDLADIRQSFARFASLLPDDGCLVINRSIENPEEITAGISCQVKTFSVEGDADYTAEALTYNEKGCAVFTLCVMGNPVGEVTLQIPGIHNVANALAAFALADYLKLDRQKALDSLSRFGGADRRFEYKGTIAGVTVIDDYAHHPSEITATLTAAKNSTASKIWCVFQPHTYTRTKAFLKDFAKALSLADHVVLADIYAARETDTLGISSDTLRGELEALGCPCEYFHSFDEIENFLLENCINGDMLITMGAGDVYKIGESLLGIK